MIAWLVDTNVLLRWALQRDPLHASVRSALHALKDRGDAVYVTPQNIVEFWNAVTRPADRNGFGYSPEEADLEVSRVRSFFRFAPDTPHVYGQWLRLVRSARVSGVKVHDARLVAVMCVHGLSHILTLNGDDFRRYTEITIVEPRDIVATL